MCNNSVYYPSGKKCPTCQQIHHVPLIFHTCFTHFSFIVFITFVQSPHDENHHQ